MSLRVTRVATFSSICARLPRSCWFSMRSVALSWRKASTSAVIAATFAVSVLMVSAGVSASGSGACGTELMTTCLSFSFEQDLKVTNTSMSTTTLAMMGNRRLLVALAMDLSYCDASKGRADIRYTAVVSASSPAGRRRLCWNVAVSQEPRRLRGSRICG